MVIKAGGQEFSGIINQPEWPSLMSFMFVLNSYDYTILRI